jgi:hypothetical protein
VRAAQPAVVRWAFTSRITSDSAADGVPGPSASGAAVVARLEATERVVVTVPVGAVLRVEVGRPEGMLVGPDVVAPEAVTTEGVTDPAWGLPVSVTTVGVTAGGG